MHKNLKLFLIILILGIILPPGIFLFLTRNRGTHADLAVNNLNVAVNINEPTATPILPNEKFLHISSNFDIQLIAPENFSPEKKEIYGMVVQHHLTAAPLINRNFYQASDYFQRNNQEIKQIVLLSPNHFLIPRKIFTSDGDWQTKYGTVAGDQKFIAKLTAQNFAEIDYQAIEKEHGVFSLMPFIKNYFPAAQVTPLVISENVTDEEADILAAFLAANLTENSLVIMSADFSHYLPEQAADFHDQASISGLFNFDYGFSRKMDVDNPVSLRTMLKYLTIKRAQNFVLLDNYNSQDFMGNQILESTTSYVSGYFTAGAINQKEYATILAFGDMMLNRHVSVLTKKAGTYDYPFQKMELFLKGPDIRLANLEGPITDYPSTAEKNSGMQFTFSPKFLPDLKKRFELLDLANNHTLNFGAKGLEQTKSYLNKNQIAFFGDPSNNFDGSSKIIEENGLKIGFVGYHAFINNDLTKVSKEIKKIKKDCDFVVVYAHWGNEYQPLPSSAQKDAAKKFIDAGADLILGSHPHVIQPLEVYKGKYIFYSLGNFIFDQYFSVKTMQGYAVGIVLNRENDKIKTGYYIFPYQISKVSQPELMKDKEKKEMLQWLSANSTAAKDIKLMIKNGLITE